MQIRIKPFLTLRKLFGNHAEFEMDVEVRTLRELLELLCETYGEALEQQLFEGSTHEIRGTLKILVNGRHYTTLPGKLETRLRQYDEVALFPPIAGG